MASGVSNKTATIYINTSAAEEALVNLQKKADGLSKKIEEGRQAGKNMSTAIKELEKTKASIQAVQDQIDKGLTPTFKQVSAQVTRLRNELKNLSEDAPGYADKLKQYREATAEFQRMSQAINGVDEASKKMGGGLTAVGIGVASFLGTIAAGLAQKALGAVQDFFAGAIDEAEQAEKATSRLHNTLDNIGRGDAFDRITAKSDALAKSMGYLDNDNINEVFQQLITYGKLTENQMSQLMPVIIDFAAKSGISINDSASVIIKALEGNGKALKEYGINIKDGKDVTERFGVVMSEMAPKVAGAAEAFKQTSEGIKAITTQDIANLQEEVGTKMLPLMAMWYKSLSMAIDGLKTIFNNTAEFLSTTYRGAQLFFGILKDIGTLNFGNVSDRIKAAKAEGDANKKLAQDIKDRAAIQQQVDGAAKSAAQVTLTAQEAAGKSQAQQAELILQKQKQMLAGELALKDAASKRLAEIRSTGTFSAKDEREAALDYVRASDSAVAIQGVITQSQDKRVLGGGNPNEQTDAQKAAAASKREQLLKEVKAFNAKLEELNFQSQQVSKTDDQKEIDAIKEKYKKVFDDYKDLVKKIKGTPLHISLSEGDVAAREQAEIEATYTKQNKKLFEDQQKVIKENLGKSYQEQQELSAKDYEEEKNKQAQRYASGEIDKAVYEANIAHIEVESKKAQLAIAEKYSQATVTLNGKEVIAVEQAAKDITRIKKEQLDKQSKDIIAAYVAQEADTKLIDDLRKKQKTAGIQTDISVATSKGDLDGQYDGQKKLLEQERKDKLDSLEQEKKDSIAKIAETGVDRLAAETLIRTSIRKQEEAVDAEYDQKGNQLDDDHTKEKLNKAVGYAQQALDVYSQFVQAQNAIENAALAKDLKVNDTKKANLKRQLNSKLLSEQEYNRQIANLDKDSEAKKEALAKKQFERNKRIQIAQTLINSAAAAIKIWYDSPTVAVPFLEAALAIQTIAEVATISAQKFADGGQVQPEKIPNGKITTQSNIPPQPNGDNVLATVKTGEVILNEEQQKALGGPSAFKAAGVPGFANGGTVKPFWKNQPYERINFSKVSESQKEIRQFAVGGLVRAANATASAAGQISNSLETQKTEAPATDPVLLDTLQMLGNTVADLKTRLDNGIEASVSLKKLDDARNLKDRILKQASMK